jgi:hypothetical protein
VKVPRKMVRRVTSLLIAAVLFFVPLSIQPCQEADVSQNPCCCCSGSSEYSLPDDTKEHQCPCQMAEKQQEESSPAVLVSDQYSKPDAFSAASEVEGITKDYSTRLVGSCPHPFWPASKDPPLYLLHSSFLI